MTPIELARTQLGVRWEHQARKPGKAIDCIGLLVFAFGIAEDVVTYGRSPHDGMLETQLAAEFGPAIHAPMQVGDVVAMAFPTVVRHVGIIGDYLQGGLSLIHTNESVGWVVEHRLDHRWLKRIKRVYRPGAY